MWQLSLTLNLGFEVRVLVELVDLLPPVKLIFPVRHHLLQVLRVEAIIKLAVLQ